MHKHNAKQQGGIVITEAGTSTACYAAATAAKSLQSCPTLGDPIDSSPPGSARDGIKSFINVDCL